MTIVHHVADDLIAIPTPEDRALVPVSAAYDLEPLGKASPPVAAHPQVTSITLNPAIGGLLNNRLAIVAILAIVGPLGLPALWLSPRFSRITKTLTTVLFLLVTVVFPLAMAYYWLEIALRPLVDAFGSVHNG